MNASTLYDVISGVVNQTSLDIRLRRVLRDFVLGVLVSKSCLLDDVAHSLTPLGSRDSQYRRLQRFLANERVDGRQLQGEWAHIVMTFLKPNSLVLLVDETALSQHLKIMVLGMWMPGGCVPIAWRSYVPSAYPACGQVGLIIDLLDRVRPAFPLPLSVVLLADRGIGTSPDLIRAVDGRGIDLLFRVQGSCRFRYPDGRVVSLSQQGGVPGRIWQAAGTVFKKAGWLPLVATVAHAQAYDEAWHLVSTRPLDPTLYGLRFDQEVGFRDLKSDGFQWHSSHVWLPDHADRLLLVLAMTYWLVLVVGHSLPPIHTGRQARLSTFRRGLDILRDGFRPTIAILLPPPVPPPRITCVVQ